VQSPFTNTNATHLTQPLPPVTPTLESIFFKKETQSFCLLPRLLQVFYLYDFFFSSEEKAMQVVIKLYLESNLHNSLCSLQCRKNEELQRTCATEYGQVHISWPPFGQEIRSSSPGKLQAIPQRTPCNPISSDKNLRRPHHPFVKSLCNPTRSNLPNSNRGKLNPGPGLGRQILMNHP
jgi:hypothetical protein